MKAQPQASHFIDGEYVEDVSGTVIESIYPATGEVIARLCMPPRRHCGKGHPIRQAGTEGMGSFQPRRAGRILRRAADLIRARNRELSQLETLDTGKLFRKPLWPILPLVPTASNSSAALAATALNGSQIPLGVTGPIPSVCRWASSWHRGMELSAADCLLEGGTGHWRRAMPWCFKPSEVTPLGALKIAEILHEAACPRAFTT